MKQLVPRMVDRKCFLSDVVVRPLPRGNPFAAHVLDLGQAGLSLFARWFVGVGQPVELVFRTGRTADPASDCKILGRVAYARVESDGNIMGIAFATALSTKEMQTLEMTLKGVT